MAVVVHAFRIGKRHEKVLATRKTEEMVTFTLDGVRYAVVFDERAEYFHNLILFEGWVLTDGLPGESMLHPFATDDDIANPDQYQDKHPFEFAGRKGSVTFEDDASNIQRTFDRRSNNERGQTVVFPHRFFVSLPADKDGCKAFLVRPRPRTLSRDYVRVASFPNGRVLFDACVD